MKLMLEMHFLSARTWLASPEGDFYQLMISSIFSMQYGLELITSITNMIRNK